MGSARPLAQDSWLGTASRNSPSVGLSLKPERQEPQGSGLLSTWHRAQGTGTQLAEGHGRVRNQAQFGTCLCVNLESENSQYLKLYCVFLDVLWGELVPIERFLGRENRTVWTLYLLVCQRKWRHSLGGGVSAPGYLSGEEDSRLRRESWHIVAVVHTYKPQY